MSVKCQKRPLAHECAHLAMRIAIKGVDHVSADARERCAAYVYEGVRSQIIRATTGIFRNRTVSAQLIESVPAKTMANLTTAGNGGS